VIRYSRHPRRKGEQGVPGTGTSGPIPNRFEPNSGYSPNYDGYSLMDYITANGDRQTFVSSFDRTSILRELWE